MNKLIRFMTALAATGALFLAPAAIAATHHHKHKANQEAAQAMSTNAAAAGHEEHKDAATHKRTAQQEKMAQCAHQSKGMKGKAHSEFMSKCLKK